MSNECPTDVTSVGHSLGMHVSITERRRSVGCYRTLSAESEVPVALTVSLSVVGGWSSIHSIIKARSEVHVVRLCSPPLPRLTHNADKMARRYLLTAHAEWEDQLSVRR